MTPITYEAYHDRFSTYTSASAKRRYLVLRFAGNQFCYVCGLFSSMQAAKKRAAELNAAEV